MDYGEKIFADYMSDFRNWWRGRSMAITKRVLPLLKWLTRIINSAKESD
jgi:hypothetical protein